jgi:hypothetical protein
MVVVIRFEVTDDERRGMNHFFGMKGLATREAIRTFVEREARTALSDMVTDYEADQEEKEE